MSNTITARPAETPRSFAQTKSIIPRITETIPNGVTLAPTLHTLIAKAEGKLAEYDKLTRFASGVDERRYTGAQVFTEAETDLHAAADVSIRNDRAHLAQVEPQLATVPAIDPFVAQEIRDELRSMTPEDRNHFLSQTDDAQVVAAVLHGPTAFPIGSTDARQRMLLNYNAKHRADKAQMAQALRDRIEAVSNFRDAVLRELRSMLG